MKTSETEINMTTFKTVTHIAVSLIMSMFILLNDKRKISKDHLNVG